MIDSKSEWLYAENMIVDEISDATCFGEGRVYGSYSNLRCPYSVLA